MQEKVEDVLNQIEKVLNYLKTLYLRSDIALGSYRDCNGCDEIQIYTTSQTEYYYRHEIDFKDVRDYPVGISEKVNGWEAYSKTNDEWAEAQYFALKEIANRNDWASSAKKVVIWFGDARGREFDDNTAESAGDALVAQGITVYVIDVDKLNEDGKAKALAERTGGKLVEKNVDAYLISEEFGTLDGLPSWITALITNFVQCQ